MKAFLLAQKLWLSVLQYLNNWLSMNTKKAFFLIAFLIGISHSDNSKGGISLEGGLSICSLFGSQIEAIEEDYGNKVKSRYSANIGISVIHKFKKHLGLTYGLFLSGKGNSILLDKESEIDFNAIIPANITDSLILVKKYSFLEVPLLFRPTFTRGSDKEFDMHFFIGPTFSLLLSAKDVYYIQSPSYGSSGKNEVDRVNLKKSEVFSNDSGNTINYTFDGYHRNYDVNLTLGIGFGQSLDRVGFYLDYRFNLGFFDFNRLSGTAKSELKAYYSSNGGKPILRELTQKFRNHTVDIGMIIFFGPHYY